MCVESRVTSLSWIPSEAAKDMLRIGFPTHVAEYDDLPHRGGLTCGIRVEDDGVGITYLPNHASAESSESADGVDLLLHDVQYLEPGWATARVYGHATVDDAIRFAKRCGARRLVLTHHAPGRTDDALAQSCSDYGPVSIEVALQGNVLPVIGHRASTRREPNNVNNHWCQTGNSCRTDRSAMATFIRICINTTSISKSQPQMDIGRGISTCHILRLTIPRAFYSARER